MTRIDRYLSLLFWGYFIGGLLVFVTIFMAVDAMSTMVSYPGVSNQTFLNYYLAMLPEIVHKMLPVASLLGVVLTLSNLNKANELVALFAAGMSLLRVSAAPLFWVVALSFVSYGMSDRVLPISTRQKNYLYFAEIRNMPDRFSVVKTDRIWYRSQNTIFNLKTLNPETSKAQGLTMYFFGEGWQLLQMITAREADLATTTWTLRDGSVTVFSAESSFPLTSQFREKVIPGPEDSQELAGSGRTSEMLSQSELARFIAKNKDAGFDTVRYEVDYHSKFGFALAGLVMALLGIPFSVGRARSGGTMLNVGICLGLVFGYWILYSSALTLGGHGILSPVVAAWLPNTIMGGFGLFLLRRLKR